MEIEALTTACKEKDQQLQEVQQSLSKFKRVSTLGYGIKKIIGPIYTRDGSSVWDELGQRTIVRLIIRLRINTGKQTDHPSRRTTWIIRVHPRMTGDNSSEPIIRLSRFLRNLR